MLIAVPACLCLTIITTILIFRKHVFEVPMSYCVRDRRAENGCPKSATCDNEPFVPVCGSDGNIYGKGKLNM